MSLATPIVLADGLDLTFYAAVEDVWFDVEPWQVEEDYRLYDATGRRLELVDADPDYLVRPLEDAPTGAEELAGLLRMWLPLAGAEVEEPDRRTLPELLAVAVEHAGVWEPSVAFPVARGLGVAFLLLVAVIFALAVTGAVAGPGDPVPRIVLAGAGAGAVAALLGAAVQVWRGRRWWPWIAVHIALIAVATAAALIADDPQP
jgi:hypothetical protein